MYRVTNIFGGQLVCTLASGETLRLDNKQFATIKDTDKTDYLNTIERKGYIKCVHIEEGTDAHPAPSSKKTKKLVTNNEKED